MSEHGSPSERHLLEARDLHVDFGARVVLEHIDFTLDAGEIAVIEGPSGGGKSTFLRALAGLQARNDGRILLGGVQDSDIAPSAYRVRVAYIPQRPVMFAGSVADNLRAGPRLRGIELTDSAIAQLLESVALDVALQTRTARELSGGEQQRVAIGRALANQPEVLLFDEPTSALDPVASDEILVLVRRRAESGSGVVVVTHVGAQASALGGTRYVCVQRGLRRMAAP